MDTDLATDLLDGVEAIAEFLNLPPRRVNRLLVQGVIPGFKLGAHWTSRRSTLRGHVERLERGEVAA